VVEGDRAELEERGFADLRRWHIVIMIWLKYPWVKRLVEEVRSPPSRCPLRPLSIDIGFRSDAESTGVSILRAVSVYRLVPLFWSDGR
jgi:hypothetical protein